MPQLRYAFVDHRPQPIPRTPGDETTLASECRLVNDEWVLASLRSSAPIPNWQAATLGTLSAAIAIGLGSGFTVDDALISTRIADHFAAGLGYRFNIGGEVTDSVTPLGWAHAISLFSQGNSFLTLQWARAFGAICGLLVGAQIGHLLSRIGLATGSAVWVLCALAVNLPFGAWSQSGMETPLIALLMTTSLLMLERGRVVLALGCSGAAAALRPELLPWVCSLSLLLPAPAPALRMLRLVLALSLPLLVAGLRLYYFDSAAPLAIYSKPADSWQGLRYVLSGVVLLGIPYLAVGFRGWARVPRRAAAVGLATGAELVGLIAAGGDWMALFRLFVPLLPSFVYLGAHLNAAAQDRPTQWARAASNLRALGAVGVSLFILYSYWAPTRGVLAERRQAISELLPLLSGADAVGTVDVGWVGAATKRTVVDFAGATDEEVARLFGSHTSKQLPSDFLYRRNVDALVLLLRPGIDAKQLLSAGTTWRDLSFARAVEQRLPNMIGAELFVPVGLIGFGRVQGASVGTQYQYLVLRTQAVAKRARTGER